MPVYFPPQSWSRRYSRDFFTVKFESWTLEDELYCCRTRKYALFSLRFLSGDESRVIHLRMNDIYKLWSAVSGKLDRTIPIVELPRKTICRNTETEFLNKRVRELDAFMDALLIQYNNFGAGELRGPIDEALGLRNLKK